ncbi:dynamin family protein [Argonema galeatum]|uniref:dynamin family protein n=1 Tax=Argonema galeatum TaxID=2942762 RepID=UPI002011FCE5|nr:dynamin family protein [Argonema galeatum]MCL1467787.1 dynamin family protein [Argonema galeatum A003/A1]
MTYTTEPGSFIKDLDKVAKARHDFARCLGKIATTLNESESEGESASGGLGLERDIEDIDLARKNLQHGVFRLLILGDMKRGKSTFLNALIGENLLPSDVNPCTAVLTVLRYGPQKKVTVYFKEGKLPEQMDFPTFKQQYTIEAGEAKKLEEGKKIAFPNVNYAVVEYPLPLLEKGIEIVDSPGLNDTEARNELSLSYINNCHAILFVFRADQPVTMTERRYLENYIKGRGLTVFFLINAWDEIRKALIDPDDTQELQEAEGKVRQVFLTHLAEYCQVDGYDIYDERVFEISSIKALRRRVKNADEGLEGTGFTEFMGALNTFLTKERAVAQLRQAKILARQTYNHVNEAIDRRIPLLEKDVEELKRRISSVEPEFKELTEIRDRFKDEIINTRDRKARAIADSFRTYILNLGNTFESDFLRYQPDIGFLDSLNKGRREEFNAAFKQAFEQYVNDKISAWELTAEREIQDAFAQLSQSASQYGSAYTKVANVISEKLIGQKVFASQNIDGEESSPAWASWAMGFFSLALGNVAGIGLAAAGFDWKNILVNSLAVIGIWSFLSIFSISFIAGPVGLLILGLGVGAWQADQARKELIKATKKEFVKYVPQIAQSQWEPIHQAVKDCFDAYDREVTKRINDDINSRQAELDNLLQQKLSREINRDKELKRLKNVDAEILSEYRNLESVYEDLLSYQS